MADKKDSPYRLIVPSDRTFERTQGCWNCVHMRSAKEYWTEARMANLTVALGKANESVLGEQDPKVKNIRSMVDTLDHQVASGALVCCGKRPKGKTALGEPVGDLVANNFLCDGWSAAVGASVARAGAAPDKLPEELVERLDGPDGIRKRPLN